MNKRIIFALIFISAWIFPIIPSLNAQTVFTIPDSPPREEPPPPEELPRQFRQLALGMTLDDLQESLTIDPYFNFRGPRDVSFLPIREQTLVETTGPSFIRRAFFQLRDGQVFIMSFTLNTEIIDHYSVFMQFVRRYGQPTSLNPRAAVWENEETRISIERPLTVKYIDRIVFNDIVSESTLIESNQVRLRQEFLNEF